MAEDSCSFYSPRRVQSGVPRDVGGLKGLLGTASRDIQKERSLSLLEEYSCTYHERPPTFPPKATHPSSPTPLTVPCAHDLRVAGVDGPGGVLRAHTSQFRGGLVFKAHRLLYHSILGLRVIKKRKRHTSQTAADDSVGRSQASLSLCSHACTRVGAAV